MENETTAWGIASLVLGILGLLGFLMPYISIIFSILAVVFFGIQKKHKPTGSATAGLVTGIIGIVLNCVMLFIVIVTLALSSVF